MKRLLALALLAFAVRPTVAQDVRTGVTKSRDTVSVGEPFVIKIRIRAPAGASIRFPDNPDTAGTVQGRDPRTIVTTDSVQSIDQTATYYVAAWDIGNQSAQFPDVTVSTGRANQQVSLPNVYVFVRSVMPADSALRVPKPARPIWETKPFPWWIVAVIAAALALLAFWWWWRRRRQRRPAPIVVVDPYARAQREFNRIEAMDLVSAGERTRFVALVVEVVRDYLAARHPDANLALTSRELVAVLRRHPTIPLERLSRVLHEVDLAKFAAWALTEERARAIAREARGVVQDDHTAARAQATPAQAAA